MPGPLRHVRLDGGGVTAAFALDPGGDARWLHFGAALPPEADLADLDALSRVGPRESTPDDPAPPGLVIATPLRGWMGPADIEAVCEPGGGAFLFRLADARLDAGALRLDFSDDRLGLALSVDLHLDAETGALTTRRRLVNRSAALLDLACLPSLRMPAPGWAGEALILSGDWAGEAHAHRFILPPGRWSRIERTGRTGFSGAALHLCGPGADDDRGEVLALHLGWSGPHEIAVETVPGSGRSVLLAAKLAPGEIRLGPGEAWTTPEALVLHSQSGFNGAAARAHAHLRKRILPDRKGPRPVHLNTWEAVGFDVGAAGLESLVDAAADIGVERFVLDDGWFRGRADDRSSLGDWTADPVKFPQGLAPLIERVRARGMGFGLWVEPEMVSPDSELHRQRPDWCVHAPGAPQPTMRHQLWLDLARDEVRDHLFGVLDGLLSAHPVDYLKWDCNRFLFPAESGGLPAAGRIVRGVYELIDRLRERHPGVDIETCASGGARIDFEILKRTVRVWPSDSTDPVDRLRVQRWTGLLVPPEAMGAHVGASPNPATRRSAPMLLRARVAMFGWMGVELDPRRLSPADRAGLAAAIRTHRELRGVLHQGSRRVFRTADGADVWLHAAPDMSQLVLGAFRSEASGPSPSAPVKISGLPAGARYRIDLIEPWPERASGRLADPAAWRTGRTASAEALGTAGLPLPLGDPLTAWLVRLTRE